jgi:hypothetical protein
MCPHWSHRGAAAWRPASRGGGEGGARHARSRRYGAKGQLSHDEKRHPFVLLLSLPDGDFIAYQTH